MLSRPHAASLVVRCTFPDCQCEQTVRARVYNSGERGELIERALPRDCAACGHATTRHSTARLDKHELIERRTRPR